MMKKALQKNITSIQNSELIFFSTFKKSDQIQRFVIH